MPFVIKATYKEETRTLIFQGPSVFPQYENIQDKLRLAFSLPSITQLHWWHAYFSPNEGSGETKFRRHVCSADEYSQAKAELQTATFPRPTLIFQVLTAGDPRLATAVKYHESTHNVAARSALMAERIKCEEHCRNLSALVSALQGKQRRCDPRDFVGQKFWSDRLMGAMKGVKEAEMRIKAIEGELRVFDQVRPIHWSVLDKENGRIMDATAEIKRFLEAWSASGGTCAFQPTTTAFIDELLPPSSFTPPVRSRAPDNTLPSTPSMATGSTAIPTPAQSIPYESRFPNLDAVLNQNTPPTNPYRLITDKIKEIGATQAVGVSQEIRSILDGFLVNLSNQLSTFEDGIREKSRPIFKDDGVKVEVARGDSPDETERKIPGAFVQSESAGNGPPQASTEKQSGKATSPAASSYAKDNQATKPKEAPCCAKPTQSKPSSMYLGTYVCDVCDMTPKVVRWHCNDCRDFDVCYDCLPTLENGNHAKSHTFTAVYHSGIANRVTAVKPAPASTKVNVKMQAPPAATSPTTLPVARHNAYCDGCQKRIFGDRYKCLSCPDWDACSTCFTTIHDIHEAHNFVKVKQPSDLHLLAPYEPKVKHPRVICDNCDRGVEGIRYKCLHPECADFDLCENCEALKVHPKEHPMLKMQVPSHVQNQSYFDGPAVSATAMGAKLAALQKAKEASQQAEMSASQEDIQALIEEQEVKEAIEASKAEMEKVQARVKEAVQTVKESWTEPPPEMLQQSAAGVSAPVSFPGLITPVPLVDPVTPSENTWQTTSTLAGTSVSLEDIIARQHALEDRIQAGKEASSAPSVVSNHPATGLKLASTDESTPLIELDQSFASETGQSKDVSLNAAFVDDVTVPDESQMAPHTSFEKIWRLKNTGDRTIPAGSRCIFVGGHSFGVNRGETGPVLEREVKQGEEFELRLPGLNAPAKEGEHIGFWRIVDDKGDRFGDKLWIMIEVVNASTSSSLSHSSIVMPRVEELSHSAANLVASAAAQQVTATVPHPESPVMIPADTSSLASSVHELNSNVMSPSVTNTSLGQHFDEFDSDDESYGDRHSDSGFEIVEGSDSE